MGRKDKLAAALLAIFLGGLGIHKFYLGEKWWGLFYLILCWTGISSIVGLIEDIYYLLLSEENFNRKYNSGLILACLRRCFFFSQHRHISTYRNKNGISFYRYAVTMIINYSSTSLSPNIQLKLTA